MNTQPALDMRNTHLRGRWRRVVRAAWMVVALLCLLTLIASLPPRFEELRMPDEAVLVGLAQLGISPEFYAVVSLSAPIVTAAAFVLVSLVIAWRTSHDRMAWFVAFCLTTFGTAGLASASGPSGSAVTSMFQALVVKRPEWFLPTTILAALGWILGGFFFLLFPDGRFVPRWSWVIGLEWIIWTVGWFLFPRSPLSPPNWPLALYLVGESSQSLILLAAQVYRYRAVSNPVQRQQTKWLVLGIGLFVLLNSVVNLLASFPALVQSNLQALFLNLIRALFYLSLTAIPLSIGVAMLRYRLWDIDLLIRRTLMYSVLTALLALVYFGSVVLLQGLFRAGVGQAQSELATVISTLAIAALFIPLRRRVQDFIDRRFYRRKYDAAKTLAAYSATLRDETDLDRLSEQLVSVVEETMQPEHVSLWLKKEKATGGK